MSFISSICFLISIIIMVSCFRKEADIFSPLRVYGLTWLISIGLTDLKFSRFQHEWSILSWIILLIGFVSFLLGVFLIFAISIQKNVKSITSIRTSISRLPVNENQLFFTILLVSFLYILSFLIEVYFHGELPILSATPDQSRMKFGLFGVHLFVVSMPIILYLIVQYFIIVRANIKKKLILTFLFVFIFMSYFSLLIRFNYIMFFIMSACLVYYTTNLFNAKNVFIVTIIIITLFYFTSQIREARYAENFLYVISDLKFSKTFSFLAGPYMYIVMNLENVAQVIDKLTDFTFGYYTFDFIFALSGLKHQLASYYFLQERIFLNSSFNTFPYFYPYYRDFGLMGVFLFPLILGMSIGIIHSNVRTNPNVYNIGIYSFCVFFMAMSFFTNPLTMLNNIFMIMLFVVINKFISFKNG